MKEKLSAIYKTAGLEPPKLDEALASARGGLPAPAARKLFEMLIRTGEVTKVTDEYYFSRLLARSSGLRGSKVCRNGTGQADRRRQVQRARRHLAEIRHPAARTF